jgi:hypothetical protein
MNRREAGREGHDAVQQQAQKGGSSIGKADGMSDLIVQAGPQILMGAAAAH